jgi:Xaa-Pro dipeptidase
MNTDIHDAVRAVARLLALQVMGYCSDISRTSVVGAAMSSDQRLVWNAVRETLDASLLLHSAGNKHALTHQLLPPQSSPLSVSGSNYYDVYLNTSLLLLRNLISAGLVTCSAQDALAVNLHRVFMPHGLGHLIGLDVHDPHVYPHRLQPPQPLQHGMVLTCEPGVYFVPSLIRAALDDSSKAACINRDSVLRMQHTVGGVRIEEVIVVQGEGPPVVLSRLPQ